MCRRQYSGNTKSRSPTQDCSGFLQETLVQSHSRCISLSAPSLPFPSSFHALELQPDISHFYLDPFGVCRDSLSHIPSPCVFPFCSLALRPETSLALVTGYLGFNLLTAINRADRIHLLNDPNLTKPCFMPVFAVRCGVNCLGPKPPHPYSKGRETEVEK